MPLRERQSAKAIAAGFGADLQDVAINARDGVQLRGWFANPANANGDAVILLHGVGDNREGMGGFAELFLSKGYAVLLPDSRGEGESGGRFPTYGVKETDDVRRWFGWLTTQQHPRCIFGMGESMGAAILLQAIKETRVLCGRRRSPFASFRQIAYVRVGQFAGTGAWLGEIALRPAVELAFLYGRITRGVLLTDASPEDAVVGSSVPILLIHGLSDNNIPFQQSESIRSHNPAEVFYPRSSTRCHSRVLSLSSTQHQYCHGKQDCGKPNPDRFILKNGESLWREEAMDRNGRHADWSPWQEIAAVVERREERDTQTAIRHRV